MEISEAKGCAGTGNRGNSGKALAIAVLAALMLTAAAGTTIAGSHEGRRAGDSQAGGYYESKIYGTVENMPKDFVGVWTVNGREIVVTADTRIKEKHGKAEPGAYIKAEGDLSGNSFTAREIEVKRAKESRR